MSGLSVAGVDVVVGRGAGAQLLDLVLEPQRCDQLERVLERVRRRRRAACRPSPAARSRSVVEAVVTPGRHPGPARQVDDRQRAAVLEVEPSAVLAAVLDDEAAQEAGRRAVREREPGEQAQQRRVGSGRAGTCRPPACRCARPTPAGCRRAPRPAPAPSPGSGRRSSCAPTRCQESSERTNGGFDAVAPCWSGLQAAAPQAAHDVVGRAPCRAGADRGVLRPSPNHTIALSMSELGSASRRAWLPSASQANDAPGAPRLARPPARAAAGSARRPRPSRPRSTLVAATRASCIAITIGCSSRAALTSSLGRLRGRRSAGAGRTTSACATATRSRSSTTPSTLPVPTPPGKWRKPRSSISSSTSPPSRSGAHV